MPPTIGVDFCIYFVTIAGKRIKVVITDTAGQESYQSLCRQYIRKSHGILVVFDVTDTESFEQIERVWMKYVEENARRDVIISLIGNKIDRIGRQIGSKIVQREIQPEKAKQLADRLQANYLESSAISNINVKECFEALAKDIVVRRELNPE